MANTSAIIWFFGITGDLAKNRIIRALYQLFKDGHSPEMDGLSSKSIIMGLGRRKMEQQDLEALIRRGLGEEVVRTEAQEVGRFIERFRYARLRVSSEDDWDKLASQAVELRKDRPKAVELVYLCLPPKQFKPVVTRMMNKPAFRVPGIRLVFEKPFGESQQEALALDAYLDQVVSPEQIFRVDHYLAKRGVRDLVTLLNFNPVFLGTTSQQHIERIEITVAECIGVGVERVPFFHGVGAFMDMIQHILSILAQVTMNTPNTAYADALLTRRQEVLEAVVPIIPRDVILGQCSTYSEQVAAAAEAQWISPEDAQRPVDTFAAGKLWIRNAKWGGPSATEIVIRTGKFLHRRVTRVVFTYRLPINNIVETIPEGGIHKTQLVMGLDPYSQVVFSVNRREQADRIGASLSWMHSPEDVGDGRSNSYYNLFHDAVIRGDSRWFLSSKEVREMWRIIQPVVEAISRGGIYLHPYDMGSWGPDAAMDMGWCLLPSEPLSALDS